MCAVVTPSAIGERSIVMSAVSVFNVCVCVFVCPRSYLRNYTSDLHQIFVHVTYCRGSVLVWRRSDTLYRPTSGFIDYVIFAHTPRLLYVAAQLKRSAYSLGLGYRELCAVIPVAVIPVVRCRPTDAVRTGPLFGRLN